MRIWPVASVREQPLITTENNCHLNNTPYLFMVSSASPLDLEVRNMAQKRNVSELAVGIKTRDEGHY